MLLMSLMMRFGRWQAGAA